MRPPQVTSFDELMAMSQHIDMALATRLVESQEPALRNLGFDYIARARKNAVIYIAFADTMLRENKFEDDEVRAIFEEVREAAMVVTSTSEFHDLQKQYNALLTVLEELCSHIAPESVDALNNAV